MPGMGGTGGLAAILAAKRAASDANESSSASSTPHNGSPANSRPGSGLGQSYPFYLSLCPFTDPSRLQGNRWRRHRERNRPLPPSSPSPWQRTAASPSSPAPVPLLPHPSEVLGRHLPHPEGLDVRPFRLRPHREGHPRRLGGRREELPRRGRSRARCPSSEEGRRSPRIRGICRRRSRRGRRRTGEEGRRVRGHVLRAWVGGGWRRETCRTGNTMAWRYHDFVYLSRGGERKEYGPRARERRDQSRARVLLSARRLIDTRCCQLSTLIHTSQLPTLRKPRLSPLQYATIPGSSLRAQLTRGSTGAVPRRVGSVWSVHPQGLARVGSCQRPVPRCALLSFLAAPCGRWLLQTLLADASGGNRSWRTTLIRRRTSWWLIRGRSSIIKVRGVFEGGEWGIEHVTDCCAVGATLEGTEKVWGSRILERKCADG